MTYIIKTNRSFVCYYCRQGRLLKRIRTEKELSPEYVLISGIRPSFSLSLTEKGEICIFCRDLKGNILFLNESPEGIKQRLILQNNGNSFKGNILFHADVKENETDLLFNTPSKNGFHNLYIQKLSAESRPARLIDSVCPLNSIAYRTYSVSRNHRLVFYLKKQGENKLGYREISGEAEGLYNTVFSSPLPFDDCSLALSPEGLYFTAATNNFFSCRLYFRARESSGFSKIITAAEAGGITSPLVFLLRGKPVIFFKSAGKPFIVYNLSAPKPFKEKICSDLSRGYFIDTTNRGSIKASEALVDSNKPWDIQIYPELDESFYSFSAEKPKAENKRREYSFEDMFSQKGSDGR